ncbi:MAG: alpha/beta hydrolase [bacterium]|nr:alpha/beta hydrolase [bacterium]
MKRRTLVAAALVAVVFVVVFVSACSGGGGNVGNGGGNVTIITLPPQITDATFTTQTGTTMVQAVGDLKVTVPSETFAAPAQVTITRSQPATLPQFGGFIPAQNANVKIVTSAQPNAAITIESVVPARTRGVGKIVWRYLAWTASKGWQILSDVTNDAKMVINQNQFAINVVDGIVGHFLVTPPETTTGLKLMSINPAGHPVKVLLTVHGFNNQAEDLQLASDWFCTQRMEYQYSKAFGFQYDYRQSCAASAQALATQLDSLTAQGYERIDILAHSLGVVITRDLLENRRSRGIDIAYLINGANHGSIFATAADFIRWLDEDVLNNHPANAGSLMATFSDPVIQDLLPGGGYLNRLNSVSGGQPIWTDYFLVGGDTDIVVGPEGGAPADIQFERKTAGIVNSRILAGNHSSLVKTEAGLDLLLSNVITTLGTWAMIETSPEDQAKAGSNGWDYNLIITNSGQYAVTVHNVMIENYSFNGTWTGLRSVVSTGGQLVDGYANWDLPLPGWSSQTIPVHEPFDNGVVASRQARTHLVVARFINEFHDQRTWVTFPLVLENGLGRPMNPVTRIRSAP